MTSIKKMFIFYESYDIFLKTKISCISIIIHINRYKFECAYYLLMGKKARNREILNILHSNNQRAIFKFV